MSYTIAYQPKALAEYEQAIAWYIERSRQAAEKFQAAVNEKAALLREDPARYKQTYKHFHEVNLKGYPYSIIYFIDKANKQVVLFSIHHHKQNPKKKYHKTR